LENEHLRTALTRAGLSPEEFAGIVGVDVRTVRRWLGGRTPYPRHRINVAGALDTTEHALWPNTVPSPPATGADEPAARATGDAIEGYGYATDPGVPQAAKLFRAAVKQIDILFPYLEPRTGLVELLRTRAADGCRIRLITEDPDERIEPLLGVDTIEVRGSPAGEDHVFFRVDDEMLLVLTRIGSAGTSPPVIHLHRQADDGLFDRLAKDFDKRWLEATPVTSREQLHAYLADTGLEPSPESDQLLEPDPPSPRAPSQPSETPTASSRDAPRRWPRRPT